MSWWNKLPNKSYWFILIFICMLLGVVIWRLIGPKITGDFCTMADCFGDGIHIDFIGGNVPDMYTIEIGFPDGKRKLVCNKVLEAQLIEEDHCKPAGGFFEQVGLQMPSDTPPEEIIITVMFEDRTITNTFRPDYEIKFPNGEDCPPLCYFAKIQFDLSQ